MSPNLNKTDPTRILIQHVLHIGRATIGKAPNTLPTAFVPRLIRATWYISQPGNKETQVASSWASSVTAYHCPGISLKQFAEIDDPLDFSPCVQVWHGTDPGFILMSCSNHPDQENDTPKSEHSNWHGAATVCLTKLQARLSRSFLHLRWGFGICRGTTVSEASLFSMGVLLGK